MIDLQQTWYHSFDRAKAGEREIHQILDFFTNERFIYLDILDEGFAELKVFGRNLNREMGFIEKDGSIAVNLGNLKEFPLAGDYNLNPEYHVKIQINYLEKNANFYHFKYLKTGYDASFSIKGKMQPEFTINIPNGMLIKPQKIKNRSLYLRANLYTSGEMEIGNFNSESFGTSFRLYKSKEWKESNISSFKIDKKFYIRFVRTFSSPDDYKIVFGLILGEDTLDFDHSHFDNGSYESYKFIILSESYKKIIETPDYCLTTIDFGYTVKNNLYYLVFPILGFALVFSLIIFVIFADFNSEKINMSVPLSILIATLSYFGLFLEFSLFKKYEIIYKKFVTIMIGILLLLTFIIFLFVISPGAKNALWGIIVYLIKFLNWVIFLINYI